MSGGFAGGLADGLATGAQLYLQKKYYDGALKNKETLTRIRAEAASKKGWRAWPTRGAKGEDWDGFDNTLLDVQTERSTNDNRWLCSATAPVSNES